MVLSPLGLCEAGCEDNGEGGQDIFYALELRNLRSILTHPSSNKLDMF